MTKQLYVLTFILFLSATAAPAQVTFTDVTERICRRVSRLQNRRRLSPAQPMGADYRCLGSGLSDATEPALLETV
jgi:hypothetical protein